MPYQLKFTGDFFAIADFLEGLDGLVRLRGGAIDVHGRLLTVDGFALQPVDTATADGTATVSPIPTLTAEVSVTTYLTPADQGLTAGASPQRPRRMAPRRRRRRARPRPLTPRHEKDSDTADPEAADPTPIRRPQIRTPQFLNHLYRDLRDRRLLFPAVALLVALIAVPVAFSSSSAPTAPPPPAPTASGTEPAPATEPAVLAEELGVTNYQKRLERLQSKNPFKQQYTEAPSSAQPETSSSAETSGSSLATEPSSSTSTSSDSRQTTSPSVGRRPPRRRPNHRSPSCSCSRPISSIGPPGDLTAKRTSSWGSSCPARQSRWSPSPAPRRT